MVTVSFEFSYIFIIISCILGLVFGILNWFLVFNIKTDEYSKVEDNEALVKDNPLKMMNLTSKKIQEVC